MQFRTLSIASAISAFVLLTHSSQAAECTKDQLNAFEKLRDDDAMDQACPETHDGSGSFDLEKIDPKAWAKASLCANTTCVSYLKSQVSKIPNCEIKNLNILKHFNDKLTLCIDVASGKLSAAEIEKRLDGFEDDSDDWFGSGSEDDSSDSGSGDDDDDDSDDVAAVVLADKNAKVVGNRTTNSTTSAPTKASGPLRHC